MLLMQVIISHVQSQVFTFPDQVMMHVIKTAIRSTSPLTPQHSIKAACYRILQIIITYYILLLQNFNTMTTVKALDYACERDVTDFMI